MPSTSVTGTRTSSGVNSHNHQYQPIKKINNSTHSKVDHDDSTELSGVCPTCIHAYLDEYVFRILSDKEHRRFFLLRLFVLLCLIITAISIGYGSYVILSQQQSSAQQEQYYALARKIESATVLSVHSKKDALILTANLALYFCPNVTMWPNCAIPFSLFDSIASPLNRISLMRSISTAVVLQPSQVSDYEAFNYNYFVESNNYPTGKYIQFTFISFNILKL